MTVLTCSACGQQFRQIVSLVHHYAALHGDPYGHCAEEPEPREPITEQLRAYRARKRLERAS